MTLYPLSEPAPALESATVDWAELPNAIVTFSLVGDSATPGTATLTVTLCGEFAATGEATSTVAA